MGELISNGGDYVVIRCDRPFGIGFNVYRATDRKDSEGNSIFEKANARPTWFKTEAAARHSVQKQN